MMTTSWKRLRRAERWEWVAVVRVEVQMLQVGVLQDVVKTRAQRYGEMLLSFF